MTVDGAAAILLYTEETPIELPLYRTLNAMLRDPKRRPDKAVSFKPILKLLLHALNALPAVTANILYRGMNDVIKIDEKYKVGSKITFYGMTSCTDDMVLIVLPPQTAR